jgi:hypothetical protein
MAIELLSVGNGLKISAIAYRSIAMTITDGNLKIPLESFF